MNCPQKDFQTKNHQNIFFGVIAMVFVSVLIWANISASNTFSLNEFISLSAAEILFPISYVINDLMAEFYGVKTTNRVVLIGLAIVLVGNVFMYFSTLVPSNYTEYQTVFGHLTSGIVGITIASIVAYAIGAFLNAFVLNKMKYKAGEKQATTSKFFVRAMFSSVIAEVCDSFIFITLCCLLAPEYYAWNKLLAFVLTITMIKLAVELVLFPLTNHIRKVAYKKSLVEDKEKVDGK